MTRADTLAAYFILTVLTIALTVLVGTLATALIPGRNIEAAFVAFCAGLLLASWLGGVARRLGLDGA